MPNINGYINQKNIIIIIIIIVPLSDKHPIANQSGGEIDDMRERERERERERDDCPRRG